MSGVGVQVDAGDDRNQATVRIDHTVLVALVQEVGAVVVSRIGARLAEELEIGVLVGLALGGFHDVRRAGQITGRRHQRAVLVVAIVADDDGGAVAERDGRGILDHVRPLRDDRLNQLGRQTWWAR